MLSCKQIKCKAYSFTIINIPFTTILQIAGCFKLLCMKAKATRTLHEHWMIWSYHGCRYDYVTAFLHISKKTHRIYTSRIYVLKKFKKGLVPSRNWYLLAADFLFLFCSSHFLCIGQVVHGDSQEHIQQCVCTGVKDNKSLLSYSCIDVQCQWMHVYI